MMPELQDVLDSTKDIAVRIYRSLHLRAPSSEDDVHVWELVADKWIEADKYPPESIEGVMNHVHAYDLFPEHLFPDISEEEYARLADDIADAWKQKLAAIDARYKVVRYEGYGPEVTFHLDRTLPSEPT